jgi:putative thiamine transport system ATP-binding protein
MLTLQNVSLKLRDGVQLIAPFSLDVKAGEIVTLMGRSGSGKSSILSFIGGDLPDTFEASGDISLDGESLKYLPPHQREIARLFQDDLLFPHMTVGENLMFAIQKGSRAGRTHAVQTALQNAELQGFENRAPHTLSGGQRSRVALMRAVLAEPKAILLDEPFSKLDAELRQLMRDYTFGQIASRNIPALMVTHDSEDAPRNGRILKIGQDGMVTHV